MQLDSDRTLLVDRRYMCDDHQWEVGYNHARFALIAVGNAVVVMEGTLWMSAPPW